MARTRIVCLRNEFPWMGSHSGYDRLADSLPRQAEAFDITFLQRDGSQPSWLARRRLARQFWASRSSDLYTWASTRAELKVARTLAGGSAQLAHLFYLEQDYGTLADLDLRRGARVVASAHQPASWWRLRREKTDQLRTIDGVIALSRELAEHLNTLTPAPVRYIPHGIDTAFFRPPQYTTDKPRLLMTGQWLRDFDCLAHTLEILLPRRPELEVHLLVPHWRRAEPIMLRMARHPQVRWHAGLDDESLLALYHSARLLVMPLIDCTANNAILEAMACGLPMVASDLPGVRDYTSDSFCTRVPPADPDALAAAVEAELARPADAVAAQRSAARAAALELDWSKIAAACAAFYEEVLSP